MPEATSAVIDGKRCQYHYLTGKVLSSDKKKETQVSSQSYGTNNNPQMRVTSTTVDHHEFFLADAGGTERAFQFVDFDFPCREANTLTVIWAFAEGHKNGPYLAVRNHSTNEFHTIGPKQVAYLFKKPLWLRLGGALGILIVGFTIPGIGWLIGIGGMAAWLIYWQTRKMNAAKSLITGEALRKIDAQVAHLKPMAA